MPENQEHNGIQPEQESIVEVGKFFAILKERAGEARQKLKKQEEMDRDLLKKAIESGDESPINQRLEKLPALGREDIRTVMEALTKLEGSVGEKAKLLQITMKNTEKAYIDPREYTNGAYTKEGVKTVVVEKILRMFEEAESDQQTLKKVLRCNVDINVFKPLNDVGGHEAGDKAISLITKTFKEGRTAKWLQGLGVEVLISAEGGDEFGISLVSEKVEFADGKEYKLPNGENYSGSLQEVIQELFKEDVETEYEKINSPLIDFKNPPTKNAEKEKDRLKIPDEYCYPLAVSIGAATLEQGLKERAKQDSIAEKGAIALLKEIYGASSSIAEDNMMRDKDKFKKELVNEDHVAYVLNEKYGRGK